MCDAKAVIKKDENANYHEGSDGKNVMKKDKRRDKKGVDKNNYGKENRKRNDEMTPERYVTLENSRNEKK